VAVAFSSPGWSELPVAGFEVRGHLLLENFFEEGGLHALANSGLYIQLYVMLELVLLRGLVSPFSLNPQPTRHYLRLELGQGTSIHRVSEKRSSRKLSHPSYASGCITIRSALQVVLTLSDESTHLIGSEGKRPSRIGDGRAR
jgi:hypothetical protein